MHKTCCKTVYQNIICSVFTLKFNMYSLVNHAHKTCGKMGNIMYLHEASVNYCRISFSLICPTINELYSYLSVHCSDDIKHYLFTFYTYKKIILIAGIEVSHLQKFDCSWD
jgi:hypothetical protein